MFKFLQELEEDHLRSSGEKPSDRLKYSEFTTSSFVPLASVGDDFNLLP